MPDNFLEMLGQISHRSLRLKAGTLLFDQDDVVKSLYRVNSGEVRLVRHQLDGGISVLQRAGPGTIAAEASILSNRYHCAAQAVLPSNLSVWPLTKVRKLLDEDTKAALAYAAHLAGEVRAARLRAEIGSLKRVSERLDAWLVWNGGDLPDKGNWHHIAQEISVSPEALYRELARRRREFAALHSKNRKSS